MQACGPISPAKLIKGKNANNKNKILKNKLINKSYKRGVS